MSEVSITAMLELIVPRLVRKIMEEQKHYRKGSAGRALRLRALPSARVRRNKALASELLPTLYDLWKEEKETGSITYPEEA